MTFIFKFFLAIVKVNMHAKMKMLHEGIQEIIC